jgi:hypothetical protein
MDATRARRTRDRARQAWYARCRQHRFARFLGFPSGNPATNHAILDPGPHLFATKGDWRYAAMAGSDCAEN